MTRAQLDRHTDTTRSLPRAVRYQRAVPLLFILALAFSARALTANFLRAHLNESGWFPYGIYGIFDQHAQDWLDHRAAIFWIDDSAHPARAIYAPGYSLWLALIYKL